jgi:hypothetical protein
MSGSAETEGKKSAYDGAKLRNKQNIARAAQAEQYDWVSV